MFALALLLIASGTLANQLSNTVSKRPLTPNEKSPYIVGFLAMFWAAIFFVIAQFFGAEFRFDPASIPTISIRLVLEIILAYVAVQGMLKAQLSTAAIVRLLTIPGLLAVDILLGYNLSATQISGVIMLFIALLVFTHHDNMSTKGMGWLAVGALLAVVTVSLFKYNTSNYNSVAAEQTIILSGLLISFAVLAILNHKHPIKELRSVWGEKVSILNGLSTLILSFALVLLPASLFIALKRSGSLVWATALGAHVFHDKHILQKLAALILAVGGIGLLTF